MVKDVDAPGADIVLAVLRITANWSEIQSSIRYRWATEEWNEDLGRVADIDPRYVTSLYCSDTFYWGGGDEEEVTRDTLGTLESTVAELKPLWQAAKTADKELARVEAGERRVAHAAWKAANPDDRDEHGNTPGWARSVEFQEIANRYRSLYKAPGFSVAVPHLFAARSRRQRPQGACYSCTTEPCGHCSTPAGLSEKLARGTRTNPAGTTRQTGASRLGEASCLQRDCSPAPPWAETRE
jgi:hypothetical protein